MKEEDLREESQQLRLYIGDSGDVHQVKEGTVPESSLSSSDVSSADSDGSAPTVVLKHIKTYRRTYPRHSWPSIRLAGATSNCGESYANLLGPSLESEKHGKKDPLPYPGALPRCLTPVPYPGALPRCLTPVPYPGALPRYLTLLTLRYLMPSRANRQLIVPVPSLKYLTMLSRPTRLRSRMVSYRTYAHPLRD